ncbi:hypothetical protein RHGRI_011367 [Rhododendron griersonianum]|uniref:Uncharacterized protein n=1 Tax=Rhododendron griersonianum TaxID=479676 RepID=A0AAV6KMM7_9ERIC|nr:hypothetical protein RHGRI_011367 [Rhododendron griersonianum]
MGAWSRRWSRRWKLLLLLLVAVGGGEGRGGADGSGGRRWWWCWPELLFYFIDICFFCQYKKTKNRSWSKTKHRCGSKSLPIRVAAADKMVQIETEHNAQEGAIPITQEALSVKGLKARSGYVKGLSIRPSTSIRTVNGEYVTHLEGKVQEQAEKIQEQAKGIEAANNKIEEQGKTLASVMAFLKQQGFTG